MINSRSAAKLAISAGCSHQRNPLVSSKLLEGCIGIFKARNQLVETRESKYFLDHPREPANRQFPPAGLQFLGYREQTPEAHAADVFQAAQIGDQVLLAALDPR